MNIALVAPGFLLNRKEATWITLVELAKRYQSLGNRAFIIARKHASQPQIESVGGVKVYRFYSGKYGTQLFNAGWSLKLLKKKEKLGQLLVHGFGSSSFFAFSTFLAGKAVKAPTVYTIKSQPKKDWIDRLFCPSLRMVNTITVPTEVMKNRIVATCPPERIRVIHSNIDTAKFKPRDRQYLKEKYGLADKQLILYYGAIRKEKGVDCLLQAMPEVLKQFPRALFFLAIRSKALAARERYWSFVKKIGCEKKCIITLEDIPIEEYVSMADLVALAYPTMAGTEGNPSCLLEAMASKTPVITTNLPELREIVVPDEEVLMAQPGDAHSLAEKISQLLTDSLLQKKMVENAFMKSQQFSTEIIADQFLKLYEKLLRKWEGVGEDTGRRS
ncbi:glycosyltransferase family 4 protein [Candidatus Woesearchaeota archaeon]|nr:glycosyltransferase family 4 protein [Candidatus Woesearchaeota archaeon]